MSDRPDATRGWDPPLGERSDDELAANLRTLKQGAARARRQRRRGTRILYIRMQKEIERELARRQESAAKPFEVDQAEGNQNPSVPIQNPATRPTSSESQGIPAVPGGGGREE